MLEDRKKSAAEELSLVTRWKLRKEGEVNSDLNKSLGWLGLEANEREKRVEDFEYVNRRLNELVENPGRPPEFRDINFFAADLKGTKIPSLEEARKMFYASGETAKIITSTIERAAREYPSWAKIDPEYPSYGASASGALIEGFAAFLGSLVSRDDSNLQSEISRHYVLAFEEVLITEEPNSPLLRDIIGWMKAEIELFPQELQPKIAEESLRLK
ncbi:hypothetical protein HY439_00940 [Candidatus Microgenomates bacterium]|nr:hypothetical protein [Candidatus Microgenomates bacterium]